MSIDELDIRANNKLDSKLFFLKKKLNDLVIKVNNPQEYHALEYDLIVIQYEANYREYQVLEYIYEKINK